MLTRVMPHADILSEHPGGYFRPQFLLGVAFRTAYPERTIHAAFVTRPVAKLMERRGIVFVGRVKVAPGREMNLIPRNAVERAIRLIVLDDGPRPGQDFLRFFQRFPFIERLGHFEGRQALDILRVEDPMDLEHGPLQMPGHTFGIAVLIQDGATVLIQPVFRHLRDEILNGNGFAAFPDLVARLDGLLERHPARIARGEHGQPQAVAAPVGDAGNGIVGRKFLRGRPGLLPGRGAVFQHGDDPGGKLFMERLTRRHPCPPAPPECPPGYPEGSGPLP